MCSQSKGIGSADISASMCGKIRTIPARLHCASHRRDNARAQPRPASAASGTSAGARCCANTRLFEDLLCGIERASDLRVRVLLDESGFNLSLFLNS